MKNDAENHSNTESKDHANMNSNEITQIWMTASEVPKEVLLEAGKHEYLVTNSGFVNSHGSPGPTSFPRG